jgi:hypothetical protein
MCLNGTGDVNFFLALRKVLVSFISKKHLYTIMNGFVWN